MKSIIVNTTEYQIARGKKPRGGTKWIFWFGREFYTFGGTFGKACKEAKHLAFAMGVSEIILDARS